MYLFLAICFHIVSPQLAKERYLLLLELILLFVVMAGSFSSRILRLIQFLW